MEALEALVVMYLGYTFGIPLLGGLLIAIACMLMVASRTASAPNGQALKNARVLFLIGLSLVVGSALYFFFLLRFAK